MNSEELKKNFSLLMPSEINGFKRPKEPIANDNDFFLEVPQLIQKDPVLYSTMNLILGVLVSNDKLLKQWHDTLQNVVNAQDWRVVTDSLKGYMTPELKKKLDGIAAGANNYIHPSTHPASMITQDTTHRFVTDTEKTTWNGKASTAVVSTTANGLMPKRDGSATSIFTGDGVWKSLAWNLITGKPSTFAPSAHNHDSSYLKLSGGSLTGALNLANGIWNKIGDDVYIGDSNQSGCLCIKGVNAASGIAFVNKDNTGQIAKLTYAGGNLISSAKIQANLAGTADKATQDSAGQQINTTYVKGVTGSNATLTVTKGNGSTSTVTVNNVANATTANNLVLTGGTSAHIKYGGGDVDENTAISQNKVNLLIGSWYSTGFRDLCSSGTPITVAINHRNGNIKTKGSVTASGGFKGNADTASKLGTATVGSGVKPIYLNAGSPAASGSTVGSANRPIYMNGGTLSQCSIDLSTLAPKASPALTGSPTAPTQGTSDNSTKIATTEFVRNLINQFKNDGTLGGIVGGSLTQNGWVKFSNGLILQWGTVKGVANGKQYNFPISFINNILGAATNKNWRGGYGSADGNSAGIELINKTSFYAYGDDGSPNVNYIVIGY